MEKLIIIKYAELSTKKGNIGFFLSTLKKNVEFVLKDMNVKIQYDRGRMYIILADNFDEVGEKLKNVFGIHEITVGFKMPLSSESEFKDELLSLVKDREFETFKVETIRSNKDYPLTSVEFSKKIGAHILINKKDIKVDVHNPEMLITCEIRQDQFYAYFEKIKGLGGYPVGSLGKGMLMLSGGIDSPVAGYLAMKRGVKIEAILFESPPHTSVAAKNKVERLAKKLALYNNDIKLHIINFTEIQEAIYKNIDHAYLVTIMRRMMYRISAIMASRNRCSIIVNGESIGQVASQTLTSMSVINEAVSLPVIRPVACFDKTEIIDISKKINTYDISIEPFEDCCTIFVPEHPVINPDLKIAIEYENSIDYKQMIYDAIKSAQTIRLSTKDKNEFSDLL